MDWLSQTVCEKGIDPNMDLLQGRLWEVGGQNNNCRQGLGTLGGGRLILLGTCFSAHQDLELQKVAPSRPRWRAQICGQGHDDANGVRSDKHNQSPRSLANQKSMLTVVNVADCGRWSCKEHRCAFERSDGGMLWTSLVNANQNRKARCPDHQLTKAYIMGLSLRCLAPNSKVGSWVPEPTAAMLALNVSRDDLIWVAGEGSTLSRSFLSLWQPTPDPGNIVAQDSAAWKACKSGTKGAKRSSS